MKWNNWNSILSSNLNKFHKFIFFCKFSWIRFNRHKTCKFIVFSSFFFSSPAENSRGYKHFSLLQLIPSSSLTLLFVITRFSVVECQFNPLFLGVSVDGHGFFGFLTCVLWKAIDTEWGGSFHLPHFSFVWKLDNGKIWKIVDEEKLILLIADSIFAAGVVRN